MGCSGGGFAKRKPEAAAESVEAAVVSRVTLPLQEGQSSLFLGAYQILDPSICDGLVDVFLSDPAAHRQGVVGRAEGGVVDKASKDSIEIKFLPDDPRPQWRRYVTALQHCTKEYVKEYPYAAAVTEWGLSTPTNLQHYPAGGGYKVYHTERASRVEPAASRHLVFMTYLNDVTDEGGTQFYHQNLIVTPKKGLTIIWPPDWYGSLRSSLGSLPIAARTRRRTFYHRGIPSPTQEKRIITGWFNFA